MNKVTIGMPFDGSEVGKTTLVWGKLRHKGQVQVYVKANDGKYYLQKPVIYIGGLFKKRLWAVECFLGDDSSEYGLDYEITAVLTDERPHTPLDVLPACAKSRTVKVKTTNLFEWNPIAATLPMDDPKVCKAL